MMGRLIHEDEINGLALDATEGGMSLRDWFAGQALSGMCATRQDEEVRKMDTADERIYRVFAEQAYLLADAMLAAREKGGS